MFSLRIVTTSHYQGKPIPGLDTTHSEFRNCAVKRVPVLRIFGSTPAGQKTCMHIHGVFPYLYVPYDGTQPTDRYLRQFAASLDKALNVANRSTNSSFQHVFKISLVSGIPMYGYHPQEECFLKIYLYNPNNIRKAADLLLGGAVMNKPFQPHESHIPYTLQLFMDYNLYGMNFINVAALKFRHHTQGETSTKNGHRNRKDTPPPDKSQLESTSAPLSSSDDMLEHIWDETNIPNELWLPASFEKQSTCELEVDVVAADIINRQELTNNIGANPGLTVLWEDEKQRRRDALVSSQLEPDSSQERVGVIKSDSEKELVKRFLEIVKRQQELVRNSQSDDSLPSQLSQSASQLENHVSGTDSMTGSQNTVILGNNDDDDVTKDEDEMHAPVVNMNSIERVVSISESFSRGSSQKTLLDTQDQSVADILAALLEESGPPPSNLASLEDQDSILNESIFLDREEEKDEEEETILMSQIINRQVAADTEMGLDINVADLEDSWYLDKDADVVMNTDNENDDDYLPQFDGASDKIAGSHKKSDENQVPSTTIPSTVMLQETGDVPQSDISDINTTNRSDSSWRTATAGRVVGTSQGFPGGSGSWTQGWPQQSAPGSASWPGQSSTWSQQQYQNWPQQTSPSAFPSQQTSFHPPSPAASFQSPPHNPYASPTHQQAYQTPSPSTSHHQYQYPPYQSPTSSQTYQQPYQSPSQHSYQSSGSNQTFHSPQSYHSSSSNQPYQSPSSSQSYSPLGGPSQPYQLPASSKPYTSPPGTQPYQSPQGNTGYQPNSGTMYPPYQSPPLSHHSSSQQQYPPPYQSPVQVGRYQSQSSWSPQGFPSYFQGLPGSQVTGGSRKHSSNSAQPHQPDTPFRQRGSSSLSGPIGFQSQDLQQQQQISPGPLKQQTDLTTPSRPSSSHNIAGLEAFGNQSTDVSQTQKKKKGVKKGKESTKSGGFKSPHPPLCLSPMPVISKSPFELSQQNPLVSSSHSSNMNTPPLVSGANISQAISQDQTKNIHPGTEDSNSSAVITSSKPPESASVTKISILEFRPNNAPYSVAPVSTIATASNKCTVAVTTSKPTSLHAEKLDTCTSTPMIQQLLMEEPARMNIRKEDRDAVMKKPMTNPTLPKPRKKYTRKSTQSGRKPGRPRSMSLSSPAPPVASYFGYPMMNPPMTGQQEKSHSSSLSFSCEPRIPSVSQNYAWQQQWKQQNYIPGSQWQQQHQHWGLNDWQMYNNPGECVSSGETGNSYGPPTSRLQQRSLSADTVQPPVYDKNSQLDQISSFPVSQSVNQNSSASVEQTAANRESAADKSSLSSLFQLVSDVGSDSIDWENESSTVVPNLFPNSSESETPKSTPTPDLNQESPSVKDFITLETPHKQDLGNAKSDTVAAISSSDESDHADNDSSCDLKPTALSRSSSIGSSHPRLGKQSRLKRLGLLPSESMSVGSIGGLIESNPAYTYTFHVPTPVFKKLKFFRSVESRKHNITVVRMHPMDARRYSLLKIGREIVKVVKLTEVDLAHYNVSLPSPYPFVSADGSTNRVNLDIPVVSVDRRSGDSGCEESSLSKFDTDFPPNKVAPPSFFNASQVSASLTRATSTVTRGSPGSSDWMRQHVGLQVNFNGRFTSGSLQETYSSHHHAPFNPQQSHFPFAQHQRDGNNMFSGHQQISQSNVNKQGSSQPLDDTPRLTFQHFSHKGSSSHSQPVPSSSHLQGNYYPNQQGAYINHTPYPPQQAYCQQQYQQQEQYHLQQSFPQHQPQTNYNGSNPEPKNGLRSLSQHGLISKIDGGRVHGHSDDQVTKPDMNTTEASPINTRVNAQSRENHAEHMANQITAQCAGLCNTQHSPACYCSESTNFSTSNDDNCQLDKQMKEINTINCFSEKQNICIRKTRSLSLKRSGDCDNHSHTQDVENSPIVTEKGSSLECCSIDSPSKPSHSTTLKHLDINTSFNMEHGRRKERTSWRKNVKALRLTIPRPHHHHHGMLIPFNYTEKGSAASSQKESQVDDHVIDSRDASPNCRSTRSTSLEEDMKSVFGGRQSSRQAKLRSPYSKNVCDLKPKKKRRKRQEPQIEGVHYIVIGKFKGHQAMLVKVKKLNLDTNRRVSAGLFEKLAAKEIVRVVSPERYFENKIQNVHLQSMDCHSNSTEVQSDTETKEAHLEFDKFDLQTACTTQTFQRPSRGRSLRHGRFRSSLASQSKQQDTLKDSSKESSLRNQFQSKNMNAGPISGRVYSCTTDEASENMTHCSFSVHDSFFLKFKENFIKLNNAKNLTINTKFTDNEYTFFEGIKASIFLTFHQKFLANLERLKSHDYSSSSDDEDDILDETILKEKFITPQMLQVCRSNRNRFGSYEIIKSGHNSPDLWFNLSEKRISGDIIPQIQIQSPQLGDFKGNEFLVIQDLSALKNAVSSADGDTSLSPDAPCTTQFFEDQTNKSQELDKSFNGHTLPESNSVHDLDSEKEMNITEISKGSEESIGQQSQLENPDLINTSSVKDNEDKEDYLKSQMAFFEDISSDSDSYDTVIMNSFVGQENTPEGDLSIPVPRLLFSSSPSDKPNPTTTIMDVQSEESESECVKEGVMSKDTDTCLATSLLQVSMDSKEHTEINNSDLRCDTPQLSEGYSFSNKKFVIEDDEEVQSCVLDESISKCEFPTKEISRETMDNVLSFTPQNKDVLCDSDEATIELDMGLDVSNTDSNKNIKEQLITIELDMGLDASNTDSNKNSIEQLNLSKSSDPSECKLINKSADSDNDRDIVLSHHVGRRQKKHGKGMKKSKRDKGSQLVNRRQLIDEGNSSSNDEVSVVPDIYAFSENKCLRQRKQTLYYTDILDSTEDDSSDSSDEDFRSRGTHRKRSKNNRKQKGIGIKDRQIQKSLHVNMDAGKTKNGQRARPSRGKKKKTVGGDKLLNSLSLLHMATLANLTEVQSDPPGGLSTSVAATRSENEHSLQCSEIVRNDYNTSFSSSLEHMSFISPQNSGEFTVTQPVTCSPIDKKKGKQTGGGSHRGDDIAVSRRLASLRPGCNGASNLGSKPLPFSRLMGNSASPIPSNFSFSHISDTPTLPEPTRQNEDAGTSSTLQLLETRRAQVNCASFSMKDILKLTTPDDSMDSDSKDSAALIRPPEPKRAQVKSTSLSMSDILKLTCTDKNAETENTHTSHSIFSLLSDADLYQTSSHKNLEVTDPQSFFPNCQHSHDVIAMPSKLPPETNHSLSPRSQEKNIEVPDACILQAKSISSSDPQIEAAETHQSLISQVANFNKSVTDKADECDELLPPGKNACFSIHTDSCLSLQSSSLDTSETGEKRLQVKSSLSANDALKLNSLDDSDTDDTDIKKYNKTQCSDNTNKTLSEIKNSDTATDLPHYPTCAEITTDLIVPTLLKVPTCPGTEFKHEQISPSSQTSSCLVSEVPNATLGNLSHSASETKSVCQNKRQQRKASKTEKLDALERLTSTISVVTNPQASEIEESSVWPLEKSCKPTKICHAGSIQKSPQLNVPKTPISSVLEIPKISVTCDETSVVDRFESNNPKSQSGKANKEDKTNDSIKNVEKELQPLHPLQIPPYSFPGLGFSSHSGQVFHSSVNPSLYYPYCWQWPFHTPGSDPAVSPLNLCTIQKSPNNYSPITPTSPISPNFPTQASHVSTSDMSPPLKKAKPLWYPWLTVDSARNRSEPRVSITNYNRHNCKAENGNSSNVSNSSQSYLDQTTVSVTSESVCRQPQKHKHEAKIVSTVQGNCSSKIANILSSSVSINNDKLSNCQTVSQFLGSVIETAYEQGNSITDSITGTSLKIPTPKTSNLAKIQKNNPVITKDERVPLDTHWEQETAKRHRSSNQLNNQQKRLFSNVCEQNFWKADTKKDIQSHSVEIPRPGICKPKHERLRANERKDRSQLGLSSPMNSLSPNHVVSNCVGLTDRLITKLIKGEGFEYHHHAFIGTSGGMKQPNSSNKSSSCALSVNQNSREQSPQKPNIEKETDKEEEIDNCGEEKKHEKSSASESGQDMTLCPVKPPPKWSAVENSLYVLGLNSVQPPAVFCSSLDDLPDRPVEHGGRVLKVESKRLCELSVFTTSQHIIGIKCWRSQSLSSFKLLASQGRPLWERLEQEPHLRFLLAGEQLVVVSPVCTPPSRTSVQNWLHDKMARIRHTKQPFLHQNTINDTVDNNNLDVEQMKHDKNKLEALTDFTEIASDNFCQVKKEEKQFDHSISDIGSTQLSPSDGDSSALVDTDLDISCTLTTTPARLNVTTQSSFIPLPTPSSQEFLITSPLVLKTKKKRKLRFTDDSFGDVSEETSLTDSCTLNEHFKKIKKRNINNETPAASSTPMKPSFEENLCDVTCIPASSQHGHSSPSIEGKTLGSVPADIPQVPILRHISTNTENILKKSILTSQTQRQNSDSGVNEVSQIEGPTPRNSFGFKVMQTHVQDSKALHKYQSVTVLSLELHIETRGELRPDPEFDAIHALFYSVLNDIPPEKGKRTMTGVVIVDMDSWSKVAERNKMEEVSVASTGADPSTIPSTSHAAAFNGSKATSDQLPSTSYSSTTKPTPSFSNQAASSDHRPISSPKPHVSNCPANSSTPNALLSKCGIEGIEATYVKNEMDLISTFTQLVTMFDPDILVGYEIQMLSWGYLLQRAAHLNIDMCSKIARVQAAKNDSHFSSEKDEWGADHMSEIHVAGRIVLNLWRILRHEITLNTYSFENVAYHVLHQRVPLYSFHTLSKWYNNKTHLQRWRVFEHYILRVKGQLEVIEELDLIGKTSEFARVFGIEFYDVFARGSQIRVESMMLRLAKPMNFVPLSPSVNQRARQRAPECIPLNLEPESKYYTSPVAVLDFQSLYPSIMIAYNYCFTTCLGRLDFLEKAHEGSYEFGCSSLNLTPAVLKKISDHVTVSPNGVAFLKSSVRRGILPIMVEEILNTRLMVKKSMKNYKDNKILSRMLDARQLGLKLIANVTYGYTGASFTGRMPCIEVGDSIVRKARESLERAIELVRSTPKWGAHVVYGDTDSMFIHFPGRSKDEAFVLGQEIADAVTAMFPSPIKLRFEKIYLPCVLQTKKRYVGFMYESADQKEPVYDAKGIETVRRDACSAVSKILERSIKVLFSTHDLSRVKTYVTRQLHKLQEGKVSIIDLIFAKEYRGLMGYKPGACVPALEIARRRLRLDRKSEPRVGERVPYVIVHGSPGLPLIQLVKEPSELFTDTSLRLNINYYITKQILPPLDRVFSLIGISVFRWYMDMPKVVRVGPMIGAAAPSSKQGTISQFFATTNCPVCDTQTKQSVCQHCEQDPQVVAITLINKIKNWEKTYARLIQICNTCQGIQDCEQVCVSIDCPIMFRRIIARQDLTRADNLQEVLTKYFSF